MYGNRSRNCMMTRSEVEIQAKAETTGYIIAHLMWGVIAKRASFGVNMLDSFTPIRSLSSTVRSEMLDFWQGDCHD